MLGAELGRFVAVVVVAAGVVTVAGGAGYICLAVTTRRRSEVPGGVQVISESVAVGVGLRTLTSVGSTI